MKPGRFGAAAVVAVLLFAAAATAAKVCPKIDGYKAVVKGTGKNAQGLESTVNFFNEHVLRGDDNGNSPGPLKAGRRSINWDAGIVPFKFPGRFFNDVVTRGLIVRAKGGLAVSDPEPSNGDVRFSSLNRRASWDFSTFSPKRLFTPVKDNKVEVTFEIPAKKQRALVRGFGAVYVDVDRVGATKAVYYNRSNCVIAEETVDPQNKGLSFLGVGFEEPIIARVVITLGNTPIARKWWRSADFVVLDDFLYSEPQPFWK